MARLPAAPWLLARLEALAVRAPAEAAEVLDRLAAVELEGAVHADVDDVLAGAAVDRALAVEGPDVVVARAGRDRGLAVAGVDVVRAGAADEDVALVGVVVARVPVAPEDVLAGAAVELVGAVVGEQLVVGRAAGLHAAAAVEDLPQDAGDRRPAAVADLLAAAGGLAPVAVAALHVRGNDAAELLRGAGAAAAAVASRRDRTGRAAHRLPGRPGRLALDRLRRRVHDAQVRTGEGHRRRRGQPRRGAGRTRRGPGTAAAEVDLGVHERGLRQIGADGGHRAGRVQQRHVDVEARGGDAGGERVRRGEPEAPRVGGIVV